MKKNSIFIQNLRMETQTIFTENGNINIYPCPFELGQHIVSGGECIRQKGCMVTEDDGTSHFHAYAKDSGSRYNTLFRTAYGEIKETRHCVIFQLRFPKRLGRELIESLLRKEQEEQRTFVKTHRSKTKWAL